MVAASHPGPFDIYGNEGHVGEIVLVLAVTFVLEEAGQALPVREIVRVLLAAGYPAGDPESLAASMNPLLRSHPETFARTGTGWRLLRPPYRAA